MSKTQVRIAMRKIIFSILFCLPFVFNIQAQSAADIAGTRVVVEINGPITYSEIRHRVDDFYLELNADPTSRGVIASYGTDKEVASRETDIKRAIIFRKLNLDRLTFIRGGIEPGIRTKFFIVPTGAPDPVSESGNPPSETKSNKYHSSIAALVERLRNNQTQPAAGEAEFVRDGKAQIIVRLKEFKPEVIEELKKLGFEDLKETPSMRSVVGRIALEKLSALAELDAVTFVSPQNFQSPKRKGKN
jgi:hypothetical protein